MITPPSIYNHDNIDSGFDVNLYVGRMLLRFGEERPNELLLKAFETTPTFLALFSLLCLLANHSIFGCRHQLYLLLFLSQLSKSYQPDLSKPYSLCKGLQEGCN